MSKITLVLDLGTPEIGKTKRPLTAGKSACTIEEQVREMIECIESDEDSNVEWRALKGLYADLVKMKQTDRIKRLRKTIKPVLSKYGIHVE